MILVYRPARQVTYCNAGHNPPALLRGRSGAIEWLRPTGAGIGLLEEFHIRLADVDLEEGDSLLFYTDGVIEAHDNGEEPFGYERLATVLQLYGSQSAQELVAVLRKALEGFTAGRPLADDTTIMACKVV